MKSSPRTLGLENRYLQRLRSALRGLPAAEQAAIVREIAMHIAERRRESPTGLADVLAGLGDPVELGHAYLEHWGPSHPRLGTSSHLLAAVLLGRATLGLGRFLVGFAAVLLGACAVLLSAVAVLKPLAPRSVGLWIEPDHFAFGVLAAPGPAATELLGHWIVPLALVIALGSRQASIALRKLATSWPLRGPGPSSRA